MAHKPMWDWMDKHEGRKDSSHANMEKEKVRQGYKHKALKKRTAKSLEQEHMGKHLRKLHTDEDAALTKSLRRHYWGSGNKM